MTTESASRRAARPVLTVLAYLFASAGVAAVPVHVVKTDLKAGIRAGMQSPVQFAVLVPHKLSTASGGTWSTSGDKAIWSYAVQVPTAVSLSFHATASSLPPSATLVVRGAETTTNYRARNLHKGQLWSRIQPGDALEFTLTVASAERPAVTFGIVSLQAGYRSLGAGVQDHAYYRQLKAQTGAASGNESCVTNYECQVTAGNRPTGAATAGLVVGNQYQCTGVLINDVPRDNAPYILTGRHCETGQLGGGNPGAASTVTVYWDATAACGASLGSLYDPGIPLQSGAQTVIEQQDAWLIELDDNPVVSDAQFAGLDASGAAVQGGYTVHHAEGFDKQFTAWFGHAAAVQESDVLGSAYLSNFWETVNQTGNIGPGASGSGLFDQNNHLVGILTLGRTTTDPSGYGSCPIAPPPSPNGANGVADFTSLAAVWSSTADTTSTTGPRTIKSILDPANTGTLIVPSMPAAPISLSAAPTALETGQASQLTWSVPNATQCSASGGLPGDGWSGTVPATGTQSISEGSGGNVDYKLTCQLSTGGNVGATVMIVWNGAVPFAQLYVPRSTVWVTRPVVLNWTSNVPPCAISGGGLSLTGLPASGSTTTTQSSPGDVTYQLSCGSGPTATSTAETESYVTPSLLFIANGADRLLGQIFQLGWLSYADTCVPSGGAPNDRWATNTFSGADIFQPQVSTPGTFTYTLSCSAGALSVQQSVTVTFEENAPYVTASISPATTTFSASPADYVTVNWTTNLSYCGLNSTTLGNLVGPPSPFPNATWYGQGPEVIAPQGSGTYTLTLTCGGPGTADIVSAPLTVVVRPPPPPTATISITPSNVLVGQNFTITWSSTNALSCTETGGGDLPGSAWGIDTAPSGTLIDYLLEPSQWTLGVTCNSIDPNDAVTASAQASLAVQILSATLTASALAVTNGQPLTLTWSSTGATSCAASGGGANGTPWAGALAPSGQVTQNTTSDGSFTYTITCVAGSQVAIAHTTVTVLAPSSSGSGGSGSGGGGGAIGLLELSMLGAWQALRRRHVVRAARKYAA